MHPKLTNYNCKDIEVLSRHKFFIDNIQHTLAYFALLILKLKISMILKKIASIVDISCSQYEFYSACNGDYFNLITFLDGLN